MGVISFTAAADCILSRASAQDRVETLLHGLSFSGLSGKRSAGLERFNAEKIKLPGTLEKKLTGEKSPAMALAVCMEKPETLENALEGAQYLLLKRSGFVASPGYAPELRRKRDFYSFCPGSCFRARFAGDIFDVGGVDNGAHPVYRYAAALWMEM